MGGNNQRRGNNQSRGDNQSRGKNQNRRRQRDEEQSSKSKPVTDEDTSKDQEDPQENTSVGDGQRSKGSRKERQEKINELFIFFKEHSEHSFTSAEIAPEFGIGISHLNSLLYELLGYGDVMKQFSEEEKQLVWYLADCHLESKATQN